MSFGIVVPLILLPIVIVAVFAWYRRSMAGIAAVDTRPVSGLRLTAEALHRAPTPWRIVFEVGGALGEVDHVVVGPAGVAAITTIVADRPDLDVLRDARSEAILVSEAAIARGPLDELLRAADASCDRWARVYWGTPDSTRPAADRLVHGSSLVEGQRVQEWLASLVADTSTPLDGRRIDEIWRTIVTGIGRPDPIR